MTQNPFLTSNDERVEKIGDLRFGNGNKIKTAPVPWFNIYPTYFETQRLFPRLLAICRGDEPLEHVLDVIDGYVGRMTTPKFDWQKRTIVLLSDKWDRAVFARNRRLFDKCRDRGIYMAGYWLDKNEIDAYEI